MEEPLTPEWRTAARHLNSRGRRVARRVLSPAIRYRLRGWALDAPVVSSLFFRIDPLTRELYLQNRYPAQNEPARYIRSASRDETWLDVALLRNPGRAGTILIFNAIDMLGVEAGVQGAIDGIFAAALTGPKDGEVCSREILVRVRSIGGTPSTSEIVSVRDSIAKR